MPCAGRAPSRMTPLPVSERALRLAVHVGLALLLLTPLIWIPETYYPLRGGEGALCAVGDRGGVCAVDGAGAGAAAVAAACERAPGGAGRGLPGGRGGGVVRGQPAAEPLDHLHPDGGARGRGPLVCVFRGAGRRGAHQRRVGEAAERQPRRRTRRGCGRRGAGLCPGPAHPRPAARTALSANQRHHGQSDVSRGVHADHRAARDRVPGTLPVRPGRGRGRAPEGNAGPAHVRRYPAADPHG